MSKFYMLVGLPGSGKSYIAQELMEKDTNIQLFSSDKLREELWGDESIQGDNNKLFTELHNRIKECLASGNDCIYDATNISRKRRIAFLNQIKQYKNVEKVCIFALTSIDKCLKNNSSRERRVPEEVIRNMYLSFDVPTYSEGWDKIIIKRFPYERALNVFEIVDELMVIPHDNPFHKSTIGSHICRVTEYIASNYRTKIPVNVLKKVTTAAFCHDIGKGYTKTFVNSHGETTDIAHYYNHERVSAYMFLLNFTQKELDKGNKELLDVAELILLHMRLHFTTDKAAEKLKKSIGEEQFLCLKILNEADKICN